MKPQLKCGWRNPQHSDRPHLPGLRLHEIGSAGDRVVWCLKFAFTPGVYLTGRLVRGTSLDFNHLNNFSLLQFCRRPNHGDFQDCLAKFARSASNSLNRAMLPVSASFVLGKPRGSSSLHIAPTNNRSSRKMPQLPEPFSKFSFVLSVVAEEGLEPPTHGL